MSNQTSQLFILFTKYYNDETKLYILTPLVWNSDNVANLNLSELNHILYKDNILSMFWNFLLVVNVNN